MQPTCRIVCVLVLTLAPFFAEAAVLTVRPEEVLQGEPLMVRVEGMGTSTGVRSLSFGEKAVATFSYDGAVVGLVGVDLNARPGDYPVTALLLSGEVLVATATIKARPKVEAPLGIPEKLGGNTAASEKKLVSTLQQENTVLAGLRSGTKAFWTAPFRAPLREVVVTDAYGYSRKTGGSTITHKGVDFRAGEGTHVLAMNRGVVRLVRTFRNYGKTVVVDHGLGVMTLYMHLSKVSVNQGELVTPGQLVGFSGSTGYAESPHLHLSVRVQGVSIDPIKFLGLFSDGAQ